MDTCNLQLKLYLWPAHTKTCKKVSKQLSLLVPKLFRFHRTRLDLRCFGILRSVEW